MSVAVAKARPLSVPFAQVQQHVTRIESLIGRLHGRDDGRRPVRLCVIPDRDGQLVVRVQAGDCAVEADGDRGRVATVLLSEAARPGTSLWFSLSEVWRSQNTKKAKQCDFVKAQIAFFLGVEGREQSVSRHQLFRLEWEDRQLGQPGQAAGLYAFPAHGSAHPHWHVDRWLTGSSPVRQAELLRELKEPPADEVLEFDESLIHAAGPNTAEVGVSWFTKLHLPVVAGWLDTPIKNEDFDSEVSIPHAKGPQTLIQLGDWIESCLWYVRYEFRKYCE